MNPVEFLGMLVAALNPGPFFLGWMETRPWRLLFAAIPVLVCVGAAIAIRASMDEASSETLMRHYLASGGDALRAGDLHGAALRFRRAEAMAPDDPRPRFGLATVAEKEGNLDKATELMEQLADREGEVASQANRWIVAHTPTENLDFRGRELLVRRLERAIAVDPEDESLRMKAAEAYLNASLFENAIPHLKISAAVRPELRLHLIFALQSAGQKEAAREAASEAEAFFQKKVLAKPADFDSRVLCAAAMSYQKKFPEALQVLNAGAALADPVKLRKGTASILIAWAADARENQAESRKVMELLSGALQADPSNPTALSMLVDLSRDQQTGEEALEMLEKQLAAGEAPWLIHLMLGTRKLELGRTDEGARHLEQAVQLNPGAAVALNNLAWTIANQKDGDLVRAEKLAEQAVELAPQNPQLRETRGQIRLKQGRWKEALIDLEAVLPVYSAQSPLRKQLPALHESLAMAYERLGNAEMARRHRELAAKPPTPAPLMN